MTPRPQELDPTLKCPVKGCDRIRVKHGGPTRNKRSKFCFIHNLYIWKRCLNCREYLNKQGRKWCDKCRAWRRKEYEKTDQYKQTKLNWYLLNRERILRKLKAKRQKNENR